MPEGTEGFGTATGAGAETAGMAGFGTAAAGEEGVGAFGGVAAAFGGTGAATGCFDGIDGAAGAGGIEGADEAATPGLGKTGMLKGLGGGGTAEPGAGGAGMVGGAPATVGSGLGGRLIMAASRGLAAPGFPSLRGGRTMRTVSFFGSFMAGCDGCGRIGREPRFRQDDED
jgi:hypothetical protein